MAKIDNKNRVIPVSSGISPDGQDLVAVLDDRYDKVMYSETTDGLRLLDGTAYTPSVLPNDILVNICFLSDNVNILIEF
jgi:hypothetical protein